MEGRLGDELLPPSSSKPGLVMNKPAVVVLAFVARRLSVTLLALRNTLARPGGPAVCAVRVVRVCRLRVACARMCMDQFEMSPNDWRAML